jgi:hypothetical protein
LLGPPVLHHSAGCLTNYQVTCQTVAEGSNVALVRTKVKYTVVEVLCIVELCVAIPGRRKNNTLKEFEEPHSGYTFNEYKERIERGILIFRTLLANSIANIINLSNSARSTKEG